MSSKRLDYIKSLFEHSRDADYFIANHGEKLSHDIFFDRSIRILNYLVAQGIRFGDRVVIALDNRPEYLELVTALALGGMTACAVDPRLSVQQMKKVKRVTRAKVSITSYSQLAYSLDKSLPECVFQGELDEPFLVVFSSGTTGLPKGIVQSTRRFFEAARAFTEFAGFRRDETTLHNWPMFYNAGLFNQFACPLVSGGVVAIGHRFTAKNLGRFWEEIDLYHPDYVYLSPTMAASLVKTSRFFNIDREILKNVKVISTSAVLYPSIKEEFYTLFGIHIIPCFGITELGGSFTIGSPSSKPFSVGYPIEGVQITIDDTEYGHILINSPFMALGYLDERGETSPIDATEPFPTGDLGRLEDNELFVSGRKSDSIKKGGEMINLSEIEDMVIASQLCAECLAIGRPDIFWGETYDLVFVPHEHSNHINVRDSLSRLFNESLPLEQRPADIKNVDAIPKTVSGKAVKRLLHFETG